MVETTFPSWGESEWATPSVSPPGLGERFNERIGRVSDFIILENAIVPFHIGCTKEERQGTQPVRLDVEMEYDTQAAGASDDLGATLNYETAFHRIETIAGARHYKLLETVCEEIAAAMLDLGALVVRVKASKERCPIPGFQGRASIQIERHRKD